MMGQPPTRADDGPRYEEAYPMSVFTSVPERGFWEVR